MWIIAIVLLVMVVHPVGGIAIGVVLLGVAFMPVIPPGMGILITATILMVGIVTPAEYWPELYE